MKDKLSKIKDIIIDKKSDEILIQIIDSAENIKKKLIIIAENKDLVVYNRINSLKDEISEIFPVLNQIKKEGNRRTSQGKMVIKELDNICLRAKRSMDLIDINNKITEFEWNQTISDVYNFLDKSKNTLTHLQNLPYPHIGITVVGFIGALIPFYNLLSIIFGGYLALNRDVRAQINGVLMIVLVIIVLLFSLLI